MRAEEVFEIIKNLENSERWELLTMLFYEYYNNQGIPKAEVEFDDE